MNPLARLTAARLAACLLAAAALLPACRLSYVIQAAEGQIRVLSAAVPVEEAILKGSLSDQEVSHIRMTHRIRLFAAERLGLAPTKSYNTLYDGLRNAGVYTVSASPKDKLAGLTWWFPVVGRVPYLGFFSAEDAKAQARRLAARNLDVFVARADAYSTLGWLQDPLTRDLLRRSTVDFVEILIHEMVHQTLYLPGQGAFNEGLASLIGMYGALQFLEVTFGPAHPFAQEARGAMADTRHFSIFLEDLLKSLERIYGTPLPFEEKMRLREEVFSSARSRFSELEGRLKTDRFRFFGRMDLHNASLLAVGLYHRHFPLLETVLMTNKGSVKETLALLREIAGAGVDALGALKDWLRDNGTPVDGDLGFQFKEGVLR